MIISSEAITWFLIGKKIDNKTILKLAKYQGLDISDSLRKNISNSFLQKHKQSPTTTNTIKSLVKDMVNNSEFSAEIDDFDISAKIHLSTPELNIEYIESGYTVFFRNAHIEDSYTVNEIKRIFKILKKICSLQKDGVSSSIIEKEILDDTVYSKINIKDGIWIDIREKEIIHGVFSLNLVLYLFACVDVQNEQNGMFIIQLMFENLLSDIESADKKRLNSAFEYYVYIFKFFLDKEGEKSTDIEMARRLDMEPRNYFFYKSGGRAVPLSKIESILDNGGFLYYIVVFWKRLIEEHIKDSESKLLILSLLKEYPKYLNIAQLQFNNYKNKL